MCMKVKHDREADTVSMQTRSDLTDDALAIRLFKLFLPQMTEKYAFS